MKKLLIIVMLLTLLLSHLNAQVYQCDCDEFGQYKVTAKSRLTMRIQPASDSEKVTSLSYGTEVMGGIEFGNYMEDVIEEKTGGWRKVFYGIMKVICSMGFWNKWICLLWKWDIMLNWG